MIKKILYIAYTRPEYCLNAVRIKGLRENGIEVLDFHIKNRGIGGLVKALSFYRSNSKDAGLVMIGYDSAALVIFLRPFCWKKIIYNAVLPVYERMITSRSLVERQSFKGIYYWLIDFFAFHFSDLTMLETNNQVDFVSSFYFVSPKRFFRYWTGVDGEYFFYDPTIVKLSDFTVIFRGAFVPEAGVEYAIRAAKILEDKNIKFVIIGGGALIQKVKELIEKLKPTNLELLRDDLSYEDLRNVMQRCHLSLGQLSEHKRLIRTIPNKAYESLAMRLPYLTASNAGILELLTPNETCLTCNPADAGSLAEKILWAKNNYYAVEKIGESGFNLYQDKLKSNILAKNLLDRITRVS